MSSSSAPATSHRTGGSANPGPAPSPRSAGHVVRGSAAALGARDRAAVAAALRVFEAGLRQMRIGQPPIGTPEPTNAARDRADLIASIAERANLLALDTAIGAARTGADGGGYANAATAIRDHAAQTARATDALERHIAGLRV